VAEIELYPELTIELNPDGSLIIPEKIMAEIVLETPGCELWYNKKAACIGIKLLRNEKAPPQSIVRSPGEENGVKGNIAAGEFLKKVGFQPPSSIKELSFRYFKKHQLLEVQLEGLKTQSPEATKGFLDDYPSLAD
jgi:hypothetical protein